MMNGTSPESISRQMTFLKDIAANNSREWFTANRACYDEAKSEFEDICHRLIVSISAFDDTIPPLSPRDCMWRFYRDTRFSPDKSPYKRHFGCYVSAKGRKSYHGGYYFHLEPGAAMIAGGCWQLTTPLLNAVRETIVDRIDEFREIVEEPTFRKLFKTVTYDPLKVMPRGIDRNFEFPQYVKCRNYCVGHGLPDNFFNKLNWLDKVIKDFKTMKPFMDFINDVVDDYI